MSAPDSSSPALTQDESLIRNADQSLRTMLGKSFLPPGAGIEGEKDTLPWKRASCLSNLPEYGPQATGANSALRPASDISCSVE